MNFDISLAPLADYMGMGTVLLLGLGLLGFSIRFAILARRPQLPMLLALAFVTFSFSALGALTKLQNIIAILPYLETPEERLVTFIEVGIQAMNSVTLAALLVALSAVPMIIGAMRLSRREAQASAQVQPAAAETPMGAEPVVG